ncbi:large ribosomal subunit protein uL23m isoform X8 [Rhinolophus sinicus]|uniref:large ribosomal subunit protein uL23m isoform X8 n=1 Tax=Rhinolophus sinicus TaxID=89399 RepID=UPI003D7B0D4E
MRAGLRAVLRGRWSAPSRHQGTLCWGSLGPRAPLLPPADRNRRWRGMCSPHRCSLCTRAVRQSRSFCRGSCHVLTQSPTDPRYPLYQLGNPQLRVFRTNFFIQLVRPGTAQPDDTVQFRIPMEMTRVDLRNYLERIYNVPVSAVRTRVQHGSNRKRDHRNVRLKKSDYKVAYVQLAHGQTFTFPDLFPEKKLSPEGGSADDNIRDQLLEAQQRKESRDPQRGGVPEWFGL